MLKILVLLSLVSVSFAQNMPCLKMCHKIAMKRCLEKCAEHLNNPDKCHAECEDKIQKPCQEKCP